MTYLGVGGGVEASSVGRHDKQQAQKLRGWKIRPCSVGSYSDSVTLQFLG